MFAFFFMHEAIEKFGEESHNFGNVRWEFRFLFLIYFRFLYIQLNFFRSVSSSFMHKIIVDYYL